MYCVHVRWKAVLHKHVDDMLIRVLINIRYVIIDVMYFKIFNEHAIKPAISGRLHRKFFIVRLYAYLYFLLKDWIHESFSSNQLKNIFVLWQKIFNTPSFIYVFLISLQLCNTLKTYFDVWKSMKRKLFTVLMRKISFHFEIRRERIR